MARITIIVFALAVLSVPVARAIVATTPHPQAAHWHSSAAAHSRFAGHAAHPKSVSSHPTHAVAHRSTGHATAHVDGHTSEHAQPHRKSATSSHVPAHRSVHAPIDTPAHFVPEGTSAGPTTEAVSLTRRRPAPVPPPLRGSAESLLRQNEINESEGLERILDEDDLTDRIEQHLLVPLPASAALQVNGNLPETHRYCRPWTSRFLVDFARAHSARFHAPLMVSSAVRTVEYQKQLILINGNAASAEGDVVSPHLTGATIDIAKSNMSRQEIGWVRSWLLPLQLAGKIDVEEEFQQACFHITVYKTYVPPPSRPGRQRPRHKAGPGVEIASRGR